MDSYFPLNENILFWRGRKICNGIFGKLKIIGGHENVKRKSPVSSASRKLFRNILIKTESSQLKWTASTIFFLCFMVKNTPTSILPYVYILNILCNILFIHFIYKTHSHTHIKTLPIRRVGDTSWIPYINSWTFINWLCTTSSTNIHICKIFLLVV